MSAAENIRERKGRSSIVKAATLVVVLSLLLIAAMFPAAAAAADTKAPRLSASLTGAAVVPGMGMAAVLTYATDESATVTAMLTFVNDPTQQERLARLQEYMATKRTQRTAARNLTSMARRIADCSPSGGTFALDAADGAVRWDGSLPCGNGASGGIYVLEITATDAAGNTSQPLVFLVSVALIE